MRVSSVLIVVFLGIYSSEPECWAQGFLYTHTSAPGGDGFVWDFDDPPLGLNDLPDGETFETPDESVAYSNFSGNPSFFDSQYLAAGNSAVIDGDAWWGNPSNDCCGELNLEFFNINFGAVESVSFGFAWAISGEDAFDSTTVHINDSEGHETHFDLFLDSPFDAGPSFGGFDGYQGIFSVHYEELIDDYSEEPFADIESLFIDVSSVATDDGSGEFAIDNVGINGAMGGGGFDPDNSDIHAGNLGQPTIGFSTNRLKQASPSNFTFSFDVSNEGIGGTFFTVTLDPTSDPELVLGSPATNLEILGGSTEPSGPIATVDTSLPSGVYEGSATVANDFNPNDPDDNVSYRITIYDPPDLSDNSGSPVQTDVDPTLSIANAAAGPHAGAQRAEVEVTGATTTGDGFSVTGLETNVFVGSNEMGSATVQFNRFGKLSGLYSGSHTVDLRMNSAAGSFLNGRELVPALTWNLQFDLADTNSDSANVSTGENHDQQLGVNNATTAATLIDGTAGANQSVDMRFTSNPIEGEIASATLTGSVIELTFSGAPDLYVL